MNNEYLFVTSDYPTITALNCPADSFPAIEEVEIRKNPLDSKRWDFVFENSKDLQRKLTVLRNKELRVEPSLYLSVYKQIRQELRYLEENLR